MSEVKKRVVLTCPPLDEQVVMDVVCVPLEGGTLQLRRVVSCSGANRCEGHNDFHRCPALKHDPLALPSGARYLPVL